MIKEEPLFIETLIIDNGSIHNYEYRVYEMENGFFELVRFAYGAEQMKDPFMKGLERVMFQIRQDKEKKLRSLLTELVE
jgi:hypothetical protein